MSSKINRRSFLAMTGAAAGSLTLSSMLSAEEKEVIQGFDETDTTVDTNQVWKPVSDRKIRVGLVGYGLCQFSAAFGFQDHPNVEVAAVSDLIPERCNNLAQVTRCEKTYPSLEELIKDDSIEAVFVATDAPSHCDHCIKVLESGKHVASAVPAVFGNLEDADRLYEAVKKSGLIYEMFETSSFHDAVYASRKIYQAGLFGKMIYTEGEYYHYFGTPIDSYKGWRIGLIPQWYPTHSNAYYTCVTGNSFTEVSCMGNRSILKEYQPENNPYGNPFGTEVALFRTSEGGMARMTVSWDSAGWGDENGRNRGELGGFISGFMSPLGDVAEKVSKLNLLKPALPPGLDPGGHGGSHGYLCNDFVESILLERRPLVNIATALNTTVAGIVAHQSALKDGELLKIPQYSLD